MWICPVCGFEDPICWRQNRWVSSVTYARVEDFAEAYPALADIQPGETRSDKLYYYYRGKKQRAYVYRWRLVLGPTYYTRTRHYFEHHVSRAIPSTKQKRLVEVTESE